MTETFVIARPHWLLRTLYWAVVLSALPPAFVVAWCIMVWRFGAAVHEGFVALKTRML